jgi:hypothetical protein
MLSARVSETFLSHVVPSSPEMESHLREIFCFASGRLNIWLILRHWRRRIFVLAKRRWTCTGLYVFASQKFVLLKSLIYSSGVGWDCDHRWAHSTSPGRQTGEHDIRGSANRNTRMNISMPPCHHKSRSILWLNRDLHGQYPICNLIYISLIEPA